MAHPTFAKISQKPDFWYTATASCALLALAVSAPANAEDRGVANYASYLDPGYAQEAATLLERKLESTILIQQIEIDGQTFLRLHSEPMNSVAANRLVVRASATGLDAWYQGATYSVADEPPVAVANVAPTISVALTPPVQLTNANPKLATMVPEGPLLGELFPPRSPATGN